LSIYHVVLADETVAGIARRYGSDIDEIIRINQIEDARLLWIGTRLLVPLIAGTEPAPPAAPRRDSLQRQLERSEAQLREARFEEALEGAGNVRALLNSRGVGPHDPLRVQVEVIAATARVALGEMEAALACLERALHAQPDLELDPVQISPRVIAALRAARSRAGAQ
jgi:murein DD-endopeptidase MepM/ murein hydrolase activator NlpD